MGEPTTHYQISLTARQAVGAFAGLLVALGLARIEAHYFKHRAFLSESALLDGAHRLRDIPAVIVQGRYDMVCPCVTAEELHRVWILRKVLSPLSPVDSMEFLMEKIKATDTNAEFLASMNS